MRRIELYILYLYLNIEFQSDTVWWGSGLGGISGGYVIISHHNAFSFHIFLHITP